MLTLMGHAPTSIATTTTNSNLKTQWIGTDHEQIQNIHPQLPKLDAIR